jgi:hypothetical protein
LSRFRPSPNYITGGITVNGEWNDGYLGNDEYIPLLATDFNAREYSSTDDTQNNVIEGLQTTTTPPGGSVVLPCNDGGSLAMKIIPLGYEAFAFVVHGQDTPNFPVEARSSSLPVNTTSFPVLASGNQNITHTFSAVVTGNGITYVIIKFDPALATDAMFGGKIFIRKIS